MDQNLVKSHIQKFVRFARSGSEEYAEAQRDRLERKTEYQGWTSERLLRIEPEELLRYLGRLWAMQIWGNKDYVVGKIIEDNGLEAVRTNLANLAWGDARLAERWDRFRKGVKGIGPAMMSELLCQTHPTECLLWNRVVHGGLSFLGVEGLPTQNYQLTGAKYEWLCGLGKEIRAGLLKAGLADADLMDVDLFIWYELPRDLAGQQRATGVSRGGEAQQEEEELSQELALFKHDEVRDKIAEIGLMLGFKTETEVGVAEGSRVDATWEATIGNLGRVIYVFEVQTKGSVDSLVLNLLKSMHNPAVQGVVAVSDKEQLDRTRKHAAKAPLSDKLKYWDSQEVLQIHEWLAKVHEAINALKLVPEAF